MNNQIQAQMTQRGWTQPEALLGEREALDLVRAGRACQPLLSMPDSWRGKTDGADFPARPWFKSLHAVSPDYFDLATHPKIIDAVHAVLGDDLLVWGVSVAGRRPGQVHRWHVDVEHMTWEGVSVFVALRGVRPYQSSLKFIGGSHRLRQYPRATPDTSDETVLSQARALDERCTLDYPPMEDGQFMLMNGPIWHGSHNTSPVYRHAALLQYTTPRARVAIPLTWDPPVRWSEHQPPCILASGTDAWKLNRLASRPAAQKPGLTL